MLDPEALELLYKSYNQRHYVSPDPLEFLYRYKNGEDREIVGLISSSLAYGRVTQILKSVSRILDKLGRYPSITIQKSSEKKLFRLSEGFCHRFTTGEDMAKLLCGIRNIIRNDGSLKNKFLSGLEEGDKTVLPALKKFTDALNCGKSHLIPDPSGQGASKRLHLFLRWMVRKDEVDPGDWEEVGKERLVIPLDTHMAEFARINGLSKLKSAGIKMALEVTDKFRQICPEDPVRYDFVLTRFGIHPELRSKKKDLYSTSAK